jgi:hypothetical protein
LAIEVAEKDVKVRGGDCIVFFGDAAARLQYRFRWYGVHANIDHRPNHLTVSQPLPMTQPQK